MKSKILRLLFFVAILNLSITTLINQLLHDNLTQTQIFKRIPHSFFWDFTTPPSPSNPLKHETLSSIHGQKSPRIWWRWRPCRGI